MIDHMLFDSDAWPIWLLFLTGGACWVMALVQRVKGWDR